MELKEKILLALAIVSVVYFIKPEIFFNKDGSSKDYGIGVSDNGNKRTFFTFTYFILLIAILISITDA